MMNSAEFRPENTHLKGDELYCSDMNRLYWSEEEAKVPLSSTMGVAEIYYLDTDNETKIDSLFNKNQFYFRQVGCIIKMFLDML